MGVLRWVYLHRPREFSPAGQLESHLTQRAYVNTSSQEVGNLEQGHTVGNVSWYLSFTPYYMGL